MTLSEVLQLNKPYRRSRGPILGTNEVNACAMFFSREDLLATDWDVVRERTRVWRWVMAAKVDGSLGPFIHHYVPLAYYSDAEIAGRDPSLDTPIQKLTDVWQDVEL